MDDNFLQESYKFLTNLKNGRAFLITKKDEKTNAMQIGWGYIGYMWHEPSIIIAVRHSRHTSELLKESDEFVISIPQIGEYDNELKICGTTSGRNVDKIEKCGFEMEAGNKVKVPHIKGCMYHYECKVVYKQSLNPDLLKAHILDKSYKNDDFHEMIYGQIMSAYE